MGSEENRLSLFIVEDVSAKVMSISSGSVCVIIVQMERSYQANNANAAVQIVWSMLCPF
jgi:hypothetical protein